MNQIFKNRKVYKNLKCPNPLSYSVIQLWKKDSSKALEQMFSMEMNL